MKKVKELYKGESFRLGFQSGYQQGTKEERKRLREEITRVFAEEMNLARKDGFPTSRLASACNKVLTFLTP